jgi:hypothetical protein
MLQGGFEPPAFIEVVDPFEAFEPSAHEQGFVVQVQLSVAHSSCRVNLATSMTTREC